MSSASLHTIWRCWWEDLLVKNVCSLLHFPWICLLLWVTISIRRSVLFLLLNDSPCITSFIATVMFYLAVESNHNTIWPNEPRQQSCRVQLHFRNTQTQADWMASNTHNTLRRPDDAISGESSAWHGSTYTMSFDQQTLSVSSIKRMTQKESWNFPNTLRKKRYHYSCLCTPKKPSTN